MRIIHLCTLLLLPLFGSSCTYLKHASIQADYKRLQATAPSQRNLKHMVDRPNFAVMGKTVDHHSLLFRHNGSKAVAAFSSRYQQHELVDVMHDIQVGTHFGLHLPEGDYEIIVFSDDNKNGRYEAFEAIAQKNITINSEQYPDKVITQFDIALKDITPLDRKINIAVETMNVNQRSLFFPAGTLRALDDPIFSPEMSTLGLYDPAAFLNQTPTLFMALEEEYAFKIPVVFVHGISGSAREFMPLLEKLDQTRFKAWFFHYPSGADLNQMSQLFYDIFLSNQKIPLRETNPMVIVAHSMGGLVVRESFNLLDDKAPTDITFISLASPFDGHPSARNVDKSSGLILPSWRDLDPDGEFIHALYRKPLADNIQHQLFYAYGNNSAIKLGANSDSVVPLSSQLHKPAQVEAERQFGLDVDHTGILTEPSALTAINGVIKQQRSKLPDEHLFYARQGGFNIEENSFYSLEEAYYLKFYGCYMRALATDKLAPYDDNQKSFALMLKGEKSKQFFSSSSEAVDAWLKYSAQPLADYSQCE